MTTNAQLVRLEAGDAGTPIRDVSNGDTASTEFFLSTAPLIGGSESVRVNGSPLTETTDYTLDDETGRLLFTAPPGIPAPGTEGNIVVTYKAVAVTDANIAEACRQFGLTASATADTNATPAMLQAAAMVCDWRAATAAQDFDFDTDGQSYKRGTTAAAWAARAEALRARVRQQFGIVSIPVSRVDGYNRRGEYTTRDIGGTSTQNPRRTFYGTPDNPF